jgi:hypothetical protein
MPQQWKDSIIIPVYKKGNKTDCSNYGGIPLLSNSYKILSIILLSRLIPYIMKLLGIVTVGFHITEQLLIKYLYDFSFMRTVQRYR